MKFSDACCAVVTALCVCVWLVFVIELTKREERKKKLNIHSNSFNFTWQSFDNFSGPFDSFVSLLFIVRVSCSLFRVKIWLWCGRIFGIDIDFGIFCLWVSCTKDVNGQDESTGGENFHKWKENAQLCNERNDKMKEKCSLRQWIAVSASDAIDCFYSVPAFCGIQCIKSTFVKRKLHDRVVLVLSSTRNTHTSGRDEENRRLRTLNERMRAFGK